jgi:hypothetical protein
VGDVGFHELLGMNVIYIQTVVVRRAVLDAVGLFDVDFQNASEDLELWLRIASRFNIKGLDVCTAEIRCHDGAASRNVDRMFKAGMRIIDKYSNVHRDCAQCRAAIRKSRSCIRMHAYESLKRSSRSALERKDFSEAMRLRLSAFRYDPLSIFGFPRRLAARWLT